MKITNISVQAKNPDRVNISVDGKYRFSLDLFQVSDLGVRVGREYTEEEITELENEGLFGKLYSRALEYSLMRPHSGKEIRDYLYKKTLSKKYKNRQGEVKEKSGYSPALSQRVFERLVEKKYIDDEKFARWWVENRNLNKGSSLRKLRAELAAKGVDRQIIEHVIDEAGRSDSEEIKKVITKKQSKYPDEQKLIQYLARQGFGYDEIKNALSDRENYD